MTVEKVHTETAPKAIGPYSQAIKTNGVVYCSGQIPLDPEEMVIVGKDVKEQTAQVLKNLTEVLKAAGTDIDHVVKTTVFLQDMKDFGDMNEVYGKTFKSKQPPARAAVEIAKLPKGALVEIECIAVLP
ncbi:putative endoribonuclease L-PSP [Neocallimastix californiae]|uniref:Putative endoribonuclease L-PSP n=1 Tax=Neocallimastix californiae TaxID=1754190 RepID=A0A1Y2F0W3_9FUNG|nr:putative endoribonuclease L-PSP [Neocallimastix californiae]|eukprot:ORY77480.1 putative endoribonuclease L-PSP [Neocallimastix californiae]